MFTILSAAKGETTVTRTTTKHEGTAIFKVRALRAEGLRANYRLTQDDGFAPVFVPKPVEAAPAPPVKKTLAAIRR